MFGLRTKSENRIITNIQLYFGIFVGKNKDFESSKLCVFRNFALITASESRYLLQESIGKYSHRIEDHFINLYQVVKITSGRCEVEFLIFSKLNFALFLKGLPSELKMA